MYVQQVIYQNGNSKIIRLEEIHKSERVKDEKKKKAGTFAVSVT